MNSYIVRYEFITSVWLVQRSSPCETDLFAAVTAFWASFGIVYKMTLLPFGTIFVAEFNFFFQFIFMESFNTTTKIKLETYNTVRTGDFLDATISPG
jgi:hypothetical protein